MRPGRTHRRSRRQAPVRTVSCFEARPLLSAFLDGETDDLQRARVERHLRTCERCREFLRFSGRARSVVGTSAPKLGAGSPATSDDHARTAARLAVAVRTSGRGRSSSDSWRSVVVGATLAAVLSLGAVVGGLGVWTLTQEADGGRPEPVPATAAAPAAALPLPHVTAARTLDPGTTVEESPSVLTAWVPPRTVENTFDEKAMFWVTPMSHFERVHFRPEQL